MITTLKTGGPLTMVATDPFHSISVAQRNIPYCDGRGGAGFGTQRFAHLTVGQITQT
jgi:hypothetical protein